MREYLQADGQPAGWSDDGTPVAIVAVIVDGRLIGSHSTVADIDALCIHVGSFPRAVRAALVDVLAAPIETRGISPAPVSNVIRVQPEELQALETRSFPSDEIIHRDSPLPSMDKPK